MTQKTNETAARRGLATPIFVSLLLATLSLCAPVAPAHADISAVEDALISWVLDGVNPQPADNPYCAEDGEFLLGHTSADAPDNWMDAPLARVCREHSNPSTGEPPPLIYACFTTDAPNDIFSPHNPGERLCFCDYYFCNPAHNQPYEEAVDFVVKLANMFNR